MLKLFMHKEEGIRFGWKKNQESRNEKTCNTSFSAQINSSRMLSHREHDLTLRFSRLRTFFSTMARSWVTMLFSGPPPTSSALLGASMGFAEAQSTGIVTASVSRPAAHYSFGKITKHTQTDLEAGSANLNHMKDTLKGFLPYNFKFWSHSVNISSEK